MPEQVKELERVWTVDEVRTAIFHINATKAPGLDGMIACFYQRYWHIVGTDVTHDVLTFLDHASSLEELNKTHIVLIPKVKFPSKLMECRPISLCNVLYKFIAKVSVNRLKLILLFLRSSYQSALMPGRLIFDNALVAYETIHALKLKSLVREGAIALKLDMSKAYDRVE